MVFKAVGGVVSGRVCEVVRSVCAVWVCVRCV